MTRLNLYIAGATLMTPLVFTSKIAGSSITGFLFTTSPYIHNYPLIYGVMDRPSEAAFVVSAKHLAQARARGGRGRRKGAGLGPRAGLEYKTVRSVVEALRRGAPLPGGAVYAYPALPVRVGYVTFHTTMLADDAYFDVRGKPKTYAPRNQNYVALAPGSRFLTLILSGHRLPSRLYASIGLKRLGILRLDLCPARVERGDLEGSSSLLVNEGDMRLLGFQGRYMLVTETRTSPSWNPGASRIAWYYGPGQSLVRPSSMDEPGCRALRHYYRLRADAGGMRWLAPLPSGYEWS